MNSVLHGCSQILDEEDCRRDQFLHNLVYWWIREYLLHCHKNMTCGELLSIRMYEQ